MNCGFTRVVTAPFSIGRYEFNIGDEIEFIGQMDCMPGLVAIGIENGVGLWAASSDIKQKTTSDLGPWPPARNVTVKPRQDKPTSAATTGASTLETASKS